MKRALLYSIFSLLSIVGFSQIEQINMGSNYAHMIFYNIETGATTSWSQDAWDIAFSNIDGSDGGIFFNEAPTSDGRLLEVYHAFGANWNDVLDTTMLDSWTKLFNPEESWSFGAFNSIRDTSSVFDYGWGIYNPQTHQIDGREVFVLRDRDGRCKKLQFVSLVRGIYSFRFADLDGLKEEVYTIDKSTIERPGLIYFSFRTQEVIAAPDEYHLVFTRYSTPVYDPGSSTFLEDYTVTGVLSAPGVRVARADGVNIDEINFQQYEDFLSAAPTVIGYDWKSFDLGSFLWSVPSDLAFFVLTPKGSVYKLVFLDFEGSRTGITTLEKTLVDVLASHRESLQSLDVSLYPNPFVDRISLSYEGADKVEYRIFDMTGKTLLRGERWSGGNIEAANIPQGTYYIQLNLGEKEVIKTILKY